MTDFRIPFTKVTGEKKNPIVNNGAEVAALLSYKTPGKPFIHFLPGGTTALLKPI